MISSALSQCSADMREQADRVEEALARRIAETEEATRRLEDELKAVRYTDRYKKTSIKQFIFSDGGGNHASRIHDREHTRR